MISIRRKYYDGFTVSECTAKYAGGQTKYKFYCLELPYLANAPSISCIPEGQYIAVHRYSVKHRKHLHILDVPGRSWILIHPANQVTELRGCFAPGNRVTSPYSPQRAFIHDSRITLNRILALYPPEYKIPVIIFS